jgi:hypothetical protein
MSPVKPPAAVKLPVSKPTEAAMSVVHRRFAPVTLQYPTLNYYGGSGSNYYIPKAGEVMREEMTVSHLTNGQGPRVITIARFDGSASRGLAEAIVRASAAVGYDPAYLEIDYDPVPYLKEIRDQLKDLPLDQRPRIQGDSASALWTIVIAAALLGDTLRPEVCMTGAIESDSNIGFVGKVDQKIYGCAKDGYREMVVPFGQKDINLVGKALSLSITITEVSTLAEAYEVVTGKALRAMTP